MKRRRSTAALSLTGPRWDALMVVLFSIFLFFAMHLWTERASVWFAFIALALCIGRTPWRLARERFCVPVIGFLAFMVLYGAAAIYSPFGGSAAREFAWMLAAFAVAALVLFRFERRHVRGLLWGLAAVSAVVSLLSTDVVCEGPLYGGFIALMEQFGASGVYSNLETIRNRVNGLYNDANVTGSLFALGTLVSLYLVQTGEKWWKRLLACVLVSTSALGILLSVSRGAILCFGLSLVVWLVAVGKGQRLRLFLLMLVGAGVCFLAAIPAMAAVVPGTVLPNLLSVASGGVIYLLDWALGERLERFLGAHTRVVVLAAAAAVLIAAYGFAAVRVTGPYTLGEAALTRALDLAPGTYTVSGEWDGEIRAQVVARSRLEVLQSRGEYSVLYDGPLEDAAFTVTGGEFELRVQFTGAPGDTLRQVVLSDGTELPLGYPLLPDAIADRLQGDFFSGNSFLLRVQFDRDAWSIFTRRPLFGYGLGSTDNLYPAIQPFYYTSRYAHNHLLQVMADMGLVGLAAFLTFLGGVLWVLLRRLRREGDPLAAMLLACWVMMNTHSLMEINFSLQAYQCLAFLLLLLPVVLYGEPVSEKAAKTGTAAVCCTVWLYLAVFGGLLELRQRVQHASASLRAASMEQLMSALDGYARQDVFDPAPYQLEYVATALQDNSGQYSGKMLEYVEKIRSSGNYPANFGLLEYYYLPAGDFQGLFACSRECLAQRRSYADVWNGQVEFYRTKVLPAAGEARMAEFTEGVQAFRALLEETNRNRMERIVLTEENRAFVDAVCGGSSYASLMGQGR